MSSRDLQSQIDSLCQRIRVLEIEAGLVAAPEAEEATSSSVGGYSATATGSPVPLVEEDGVLGWDRRLQIARDTGNIFRRCLEGRDRRRSAQPKVGLPKRVYVVVRDRDKAGKVYRDPVRVFFRFSDVAPLVQDRGGFADSIFAGFASQREAKEAVRETGLVWPGLSR
eukprot:s7683_g2.t1